MNLTEKCKEEVEKNINDMTELLTMFYLKLIDTLKLINKGNNKNEN